MAYVIDTDLAASAAGKGADMVGFAQSGGGASHRTTADKLRETVSILDFGGVGDGVTDNTAALMAALLTNKPVFFPGTENGVPYLVSGNFDFAAIKAATGKEIPVVALHGEGAARSVVKFTGSGTFLKGGTTVSNAGYPGMGYPQVLSLDGLGLVGAGVKGASIAVTYGQFTTQAGNGYAGCDSTQTAIEWEFEPMSSVRNCMIECFGTGIRTHQGYAYTISECHIRFNMIGLDLRAATTTGNVVGNMIERNGIGIGIWTASLLSIRANAIQGNYAGADVVSYNWSTQVKFDSNYFEATENCFVQNGDSAGEYISNNFVFVDNKGLSVNIVDCADRFYFIRNRLGSFSVGDTYVSHIVVEDNTENEANGLVSFTDFQGSGASALLNRSAPLLHRQPYTASPSIGHGLSDSFNVIIPGAARGDRIEVTHTGLKPGWEAAGNCIGPDTVRVDLRNFTGASDGGFSGTLTVLVFRT